MHSLRKPHPSRDAWGRDNYLVQIDALAPRGNEYACRLPSSLEDLGGRMQA